MVLRIREGIFLLHFWAKTSPSRTRVIETTLYLGPLKKTGPGHARKEKKLGRFLILNREQTCTE